MPIRICLFVICALLSTDLWGQKVSRDTELDYPSYKPADSDIVISRSDYHEKLEGFWLAECIANWTGLRTEGVKKTAPFYTDADWGTKRGRKKNGSPQMIEFVLVEEGSVWGADDDTDIEYIYQSILDTNNASVVNPRIIEITVASLLCFLIDASSIFLASSIAVSTAASISASTSSFV